MGQAGRIDQGARDDRRQHRVLVRTDEAGVSAEGSGFRGVSLHFIVGSNEEVDDAIRRVEKAGGSVVKEPADVQWGYFGYFADPDGYLWKVATSG